MIDLGIDAAEFGKAMGSIVRDAVAPLLKRIEDLELALEATEKLDVAEVVTQMLGRPELKTLVDLQTAESIVGYFTENPVLNGKDAAPVDVKAVASALAVADEIKAAVSAAVSGHFEANPVKNGDKGDPGERGETGAKGEDGEGLAAFIINRDGELIGSTTKGNHVVLGQVVGKDGAPGRDGKDGQDLTGAELDYDGERGLIIRHNGSEIVKRMPIPMDRGYYREGMTAEKGDIVTTEGSAWIALQDTDTKPGHDQKDAWRMFARKGKDGERGEKGVPYVPPAPVKLGNGNG